MFFMRRIFTTCIATASVLALSACADFPGAQNLTPTNEGIFKTAYTSSVAPQDLRERMSEGKGVKIAAMLTEQMRSSVRELSQMEQTLAVVRSDLMTIVPHLKKLEKLHKDIAAMNDRFRGMLDQVDASVAPQPASTQPPVKLSQAQPSKNYTVHKAKPKSAAAKPVQAQSKLPNTPGVVGVRVGEHNGKTRLVLDIVGAASPQYDIDNAERLMTIELPNTPWMTSLNKSFGSKAKMVKTYHAEAQEGGSLIVLSLKGDTKVLDHFVLKATASKPARLVFDLAH